MTQPFARANVELAPDLFAFGVCIILIIVSADPMYFVDLANDTIDPTKDGSSFSYFRNIANTTSWPKTFFTAFPNNTLRDEMIALVKQLVCISPKDRIDTATFLRRFKELNQAYLNKIIPPLLNTRTPDSDPSMDTAGNFSSSR